MDYEKKIEIPFGAHDSELKGWEYTIPEGFTAEIKDGKVIVREKESEDKRIRKWLYDLIDRMSYDNLTKEEAIKNKNWKKKVLAYLEKQKEQKPQGAYIDCTEHPEWYGMPAKVQKPAEWSEEDENMRNNILRVLSAFMGTVECESNPSLSTSYPTYLREINWLKSLRPKPHWKPSEEQMEALDNARFCKSYDRTELDSLYDDLKKLM